MDAYSRGMHNSSVTKGLILDRSNIIFSASKGETSNMLGGDQENSMMIDTKRDDHMTQLLDELDLSGDEDLGGR